MVAHCCVYGCGNKYNKDGVKLFRLPTSDPEKLSVWLTLIGRKDLLKKSQKQKLTQRICSDHFREEYYKYGKTLHKDAVPCRNLIIISEESEEARPSTSKTGLCLKRHDSCRADEPLAKVTKKRVVPMENVKIIDIKEGSPPERLLTKEAFLESCDQYLDEKTSKIVKKQLALRKGHKSIKTPNQANSSDVKNTDKDNNEIKETDKEDNSDRIKTKMLYLSQRGIQISDIDETLTLSEDHIEELDATIKEEEIQIQDTFEIKEEGDVYEDVDQDPLLEVDSVLEDEVKISVSLPKNLSENPIMSSTRVEAMHISENYFNLNRKYTTKIDNKKCSDIRKYANNLDQFNITNSTVTIVNSKEANKPFVKTETKDWVNDKTKLLMQMCKPLSIILVDCKPLLQYKFCNRHNKLQFQDNFLDCKACVSYYNMNENMRGKRKKYAAKILNPRIKNSNSNKQSAKNIRFPLVFKKLYNVWVVMTNTYINSTEIFYINPDLETLTDYYYLKYIISNKTKLLSFTKNNSRFEFINCCWHKRYKHILKVWPTVVTETSQMLVNIISHACPPNNCICCCNENAGSKSLHLTLELPSEKSRADFQLFLSNADANNKNSWINKALEFQTKPKPKAFKRVPISQPSSSEPLFVVNKTSPFENFDYYHVLGPDAQMLSYMKVGKYDKSHQAYRSTLAESGLKIVNDSSCCSLKRQKILSELPRQMINFLQKTPHNYFTQNKNLCCKSTINSPQVQLNELEQTISHTKKNTTRLKEVLKNIDLPSTCIVQDDCALTCKNQDSKHQSHYLHKEHTYKRLQGHQEIYTTWLNNVHSKQSVNPLEIDNQQSGNVLTDTAHTPMLMTTIPQPSEPLTPEDPTVKALIASILERFKNIHLSLSAEGKVVALLDAPAASLSNEELTILSDILTRAQEQIQSFGIIDSSSSNLADPLNANQNIINMGFTHSQQLSTDVENEKTAYDCTNNIPSNMNDQGNLNEIKRNSALEKAREEIYSSSNLYEIYSNLSYFKNIQIKHSLETYSKRGQELLGPKIMNVYSLNNDTSIANPTVKRTYQNNTRMRNALTSKETKTYSPSSCSLSKNKKIFKTLITVPRMKNKNISTMVMNQTKRQYMLQSIPQGVQTNYASPALNVPLHCFLSPNNDGSSIVRVPAIENNKISMRYPQSAPHITILNKTDNKDNEDDCILGV